MANPDIYRPIVSPEEAQAEAEANLEKLKENDYPGRGIVMGLSDDGAKMVQVYWAMGRSPSSQNRVFVVDEDKTVRVDRFDNSVPVPPGQEALIFYNAMRQRFGVHVVTNGSQTDEIIENFPIREFSASLGFQDHEPDYPNFTPRISAVYSNDNLWTPGGYQSIGIVKPETPNTDDTDQRDIYNYGSFQPGIGRAIHTYAGNGNPLPAFQNEPYKVPLTGDAQDILETYWGVLNPDNRVALAVKTIDIATGQFDVIVQNRHLVSQEIE